VVRDVSEDHCRLRRYQPASWKRVLAAVIESIRRGVPTGPEKIAILGRTRGAVATTSWLP
jgi:hypothetical protein